MLKKYYLLIKKSIAFFFNSPSPRPLPSGERGRVRGANLKEFNAFVLDTNQ
jgi:hypothetical protein